MKNYDLVVIGGGPAGMSAAITAESEGIQTLLIERRTEGWGGQASESSAIENYFGFPQGVTGVELTQRGIAQAKKFGTELLMPCSVSRVKREDGKILVMTDDGTIIPTRTVILALGVSYRLLEAEGVSRLVGCGVKYGSPHLDDGFQNKKVVVVGGANSAGQAVVHLSKQPGCEVHMVVRNETLSTNMLSYLIDRIQGRQNVKVHFKSQIKEAIGDEGLRGVTCTGNDIPTGWWTLSRPPFFLESSTQGVFVAGDVPRHGSIKRIALAAAEGAMAVQNIHGYLAL